MYYAVYGISVYSIVHLLLVSSAIAVSTFHGLRHRNRFSNSIIIVDGVACLWGSSEGDQMALIILIAEIRRLAKAARRLRIVSRLAIAHVNVRALVVVSLRGVLFPVVGVEDVENGKTGADQSDTTLGITGDCQRL